MLPRIILGSVEAFAASGVHMTAYQRQCGIWHSGSSLAEWKHINLEISGRTGACEAENGAAPMQWEAAR